MNPSTLMPRKTWPVKEASMPDTLAHRYDETHARRRARPAAARVLAARDLRGATASATAA